MLPRAGPARDSNAASMGGDDAFGHGQPKTRALDSRCFRGVRTDEFLENSFLFGGDAHSLVANAYCNLISFLAGFDPDHL